MYVKHNATERGDRGKKRGTGDHRQDLCQWLCPVLLLQTFVGLGFTQDKRTEEVEAAHSRTETRSIFMVLFTQTLQMD